MQFEKLAFVDIETTGASPNVDRVIEIGVLRVEKGQLVKTYSTLVDPDCQISPFITNITGIVQKDVESAPSFHQIADDLRELLSGCTFVAHNVRFDYGFLKAEFARAGIDFDADHFCTAKLSRSLYPRYRRHNLDSIIRRHKITCENRHRAFDDAKVLWDFFQKVSSKFPQKRIISALGNVSKRTSWPAAIPKEQIANLPNTPGVYIFYGDNNVPIYVGKSINLKNRITSHFTDDIHSVKEMKITQQIKNIEVIETAGELGALILESNLIKKLMPVYNRQLRLSKSLTVAHAHKDVNGFATVKLLNTDEFPITAHNLDNILGVFKSKRQAQTALKKIADEHRLCKKLMGLEKGTARCFGYYLKKCDGACIKLESTNIYNLRFEIAFSKLKFKKWPFEQPIIIAESSSQKQENYLIDRWCFLKKMEEEDFFTTLKADEIKFDFDIYKILKSFLLNPKNQGKIRLFKPQVVLSEY
ncbi:MAG TPA: exonuclease domain-containing protein [Verrucomicrobiae bacterium]|nr:exonuclease domain-containing protein [Verrucomicrobiae bacterium]